MHKQPIFVHSISTKNIGDRNCCPADAIGINGEKMHIKSKKIYDISNRLIVIGGGGLLQSSFLGFIKSLIEKNKVIMWGIGSNTHSTTDIRYPEILNHNNILNIGIRDYNNGLYKYVPCPSCLLKVFDYDYEIKNKIGVYEHYDYRIDTDFPKMCNNSENLLDVISFLGSCDTIITNTYHGAYWSMLLGRKTLIYRPFSTRFYTFKYKPPIIYNMNEAMPKNIASFPEYLFECRDLNMQYYKSLPL